MKKMDRRLLGAIAASGAVMALWLVLMGGIVGSTLSPAERDAVEAVLAPRAALLVMGWIVGMLLVAAVWRQLYQRYIGAPQQLLEETRVVLTATTPQQLKPRGTVEMQALADAVNELAAQRDRLRADMAAQVAQTSERLQQERDRLAALMAELNQSVVVCNRDGRILLYNQHARQQFRALSQEPGVADGTGLVGIGRSIYAVLDARLLAHALDRLAHSVGQGEEHPAAQFVTTTGSGQLLRVQVAPVRAVGDDGMALPKGQRHPAATQNTFSGFVLLLNDVTASVREEAERDQLLHGMTEGSRASLANIQTAVDMLGYADLEPAMRDRFLTVVRDEVGTMGRRIADLAQRATQRLTVRWPLEDMRGSDLATAAQRQIANHCTCPVTLDGVDDNLWLKVDSYTLLQALTYLAHRLVDEFDVRFLQLRLHAAGAHVHLDLVWSGQAMSNETVMSWEMDSMRFGTERSPLSVREVVERHGGEMWFERDRTRHQAFFRFMLPLAREQSASQRMPARGEDGDSSYDSRPEYYDFDLFQISEHTSALDERLLSELTYTVFDTETTGLNPAGGDAILQIGAARIVNGKLLRQECFEQLVNPGRAIPAASIPIHGISEDMVLDKPRIADVLPVFHAFAHDTVLVAHNAAFDMRFLQLQEKATGIAFGQPVLDTLLLSAVVHPFQVSHRLEAIAERFNITLRGRHTALGDALVTAEIWLRLIPLLQAQGIHTLRQAREAAQKTYYARLKY